MIIPIRLSIRYIDYPLDMPWLDIPSGYDSHSHGIDGLFIDDFPS